MAKDLAMHVNILKLKILKHWVKKNDAKDPELVPMCAQVLCIFIMEETCRLAAG